MPHPYTYYSNYERCGHHVQYFHILTDTDANSSTKTGTSLSSDPLHPETDPGGAIGVCKTSRMRLGAEFRPPLKPDIDLCSKATNETHLSLDKSVKSYTLDLKCFESKA